MEDYAPVFHEHMIIHDTAEPGEKVDELVKLSAFCTIEQGFIHIHVKRILFHVVYKSGHPNIDPNIEKVIGKMSGYVGSIKVSLREIRTGDDVAKIIKMTFDHEEDWNTTDVYVVATDNDRYDQNMDWDLKSFSRCAKKYANYFDYIPRAQQC